MAETPPIDFFLFYISQAVQTSSAHEVAVKVAGYLLGEFGYYIAEHGDSGCASDSTPLALTKPSCEHEASLISPPSVPDGTSLARVRLDGSKDGCN